jgi:hypothetical protein
VELVPLEQHESVAVEISVRGARASDGHLCRVCRFVRNLFGLGLKFSGKGPQAPGNAEVDRSPRETEQGFGLSSEIHCSFHFNPPPWRGRFQSSAINGTTAASFQLRLAGAPVADVSH